MITADDLEVDADLGRRVLLYAATVAPCLQTLDGDERLSAIAILKSIALDVETHPGYRVKSRTRGEWTTAYFSDSELSSIISTADRDALRLLCGMRGSTAGPVGRFPRPHRPLLSMWPEDAA